jgi:hypothetical protein
VRTKFTNFEFSTENNVIDVSSLALYAPPSTYHCQWCVLTSPIFSDHLRDVGGNVQVLYLERALMAVGWGSPDRHSRGTNRIQLFKKGPMRFRNTLSTSARHGMFQEFVSGLFPLPIVNNWVSSFPLECIVKNFRHFHAVLHEQQLKWPSTRLHTVQQTRCNKST